MSFKDEVKRVLLEKGHLMITEEKSYYWGWHDYEDDIGMRYGKQVHKEGCRWVGTEASRVIEKSHYEFAGTDCDSQQTTLLVLTDVDCSCGHVKGRRIAREGSTGELLRELLGIEVEFE